MAARRKAAGRKRTARPAKARAKTRAKPRAEAARKKATPAARQKTPARKPARKTVRKTAAAPRPPSARLAAAKAVPIGVVTHYFPRAAAGVIALRRAALHVGDLLHFRGHTTDFLQRVERLEVEHAPVAVAGAGSVVAVQLSQRVRDGDRVLRVEAR